MLPDTILSEILADLIVAAVIIICSARTASHFAQLSYSYLTAFASSSFKGHSLHNREEYLGND